MTEQTRNEYGIEEHRHEGADWWHAVTRKHTVNINRTGQTFNLTGCGVGCGYWEGEPDFGGYKNACTECQEQNGSCHVVEKVREIGGIIE